MSKAEELVAKLKDLQIHVTTAESCTGGMVASEIVRVSGASSVFEQGYITYSNEAKEKELKVKADILEQYTEYSPQTAAAMARGAAAKSGAEVAISVTGIAGPDGGTEEKPVGYVCIGCYIVPEVLTTMVEKKPGIFHIDMPEAGKCVVKEYHFQGDREEIRQQATEAAIELACKGVGYIVERCYG